MKVIIQNIRQGAGEIGQIDLSSIAQEKYTNFAVSLNEIAGAQLVPNVQPSARGYFPSSVTQQVYLNQEQEGHLRRLLKSFNTMNNLSKTFFKANKQDVYL